MRISNHVLFPVFWKTSASNQHRPKTAVWLRTPYQNMQPAIPDKCGGGLCHLAVSGGSSFGKIEFHLTKQRLSYKAFLFIVLISCSLLCRECSKFFCPSIQINICWRSSGKICLTLARLDPMISEDKSGVTKTKQHLLIPDLFVTE